MTRQTKDNCNSETIKNPSIVTLDYDLYAQYLDDADLSEDQKRELLETLWNIICEFVALGFEIHPTQQAQKACGKTAETRKTAPLVKPNAVQLNSQFLENKFSDAAGRDDRHAAGRIPE